MTPDIRRLEPHDQTPPGYVRFAYYVTYQPPKHEQQRPAVLHVAAVPNSLTAGERTDAAEAFLAYDRRHRPNNSFIFSGWLETPGEPPVLPYPKKTSEKLGMLYNFLNLLHDPTYVHSENFIRQASKEHAEVLSSVVPHYLALVRFAANVRKAQKESNL